jgi:hypothetical protein
MKTSNLAKIMSFTLSMNGTLLHTSCAVLFIDLLVRITDDVDGSLDLLILLGKWLKGCTRRK